MKNLELKVAVANQSKAMEVNIILKNGWGMKNHTSRGNFLGLNKNTYQNMFKMTQRKGGSKMKYLISILTIFYLSSCSCYKDVYVMYQTNSVRTGQIVIIPSEPTLSTTVTLNDNLIVRDKCIKSVRIGNVPEGYVKINYVSGYTQYREKLDQEMTVNVIRGRETTKLIQVPPQSSGSLVKDGLETVGAVGAVVGLLLLLIFI